MKMHPKPMIRHTESVVDCNVLVVTSETHPLPVAIVFNIEGRTQRCVMTREEALGLAKALIAESDGWIAVPNDFVTHLGAWRTAIENCIDEVARNDDDLTYWQHQLNSLKTIEAAVEGEVLSK